jgi:hypothetical protein
VLAEIEGRLGLEPRYGYEVLCDMARPWRMALPLVDVLGDLGTEQLVGGRARYISARLSAVGALALASELGADPLLPDQQVVELIDPPSFPTGCAVSGDLAPWHGVGPSSSSWTLKSRSAPTDALSPSATSRRSRT